jgi:hypothetical protein
MGRNEPPQPSVATDLPPAGFRRRARPAVPVIVVVVSIVVAVGAVSALIFALIKSTTGPGQTLRHYYEAVAGDDCGTAYALLSTDLQDKVDMTEYCQFVLQAHGKVPGGVSIKEVTGFGEPPANSALVTVVEAGPGALPGSITWRMVRQGDEWKVANFPGNPQRARGRRYYACPSPLQAKGVGCLPLG